MSGLGAGILLDVLFIGKWTAGIFACASAASAFLLLTEDSPGRELPMMFGLKSAPSRVTIVGLVSLGGAFLAAAPYWLSTKSAWIPFGSGNDVDRTAR